MTVKMYSKLLNSIAAPLNPYCYFQLCHNLLIILHLSL